jgi:hypothetical protein
MTGCHARLWRTGVAFTAAALMLVACFGDDDEEGSGLTATGTPAVEQSPEEEAAVGLGDWVENADVDPCAPVQMQAPSMAAGRGFVNACLEEGTVLKVVGGPDRLEGEDYWILSGFGWVSEREFTFHHRGELQHDPRPDLHLEGLIAYTGTDEGYG